MTQKNKEEAVPCIVYSERRRVLLSSSDVQTMI